MACPSSRRSPRPGAAHSSAWAAGFSFRSVLERRDSHGLAIGGAIGGLDARDGRLVGALYRAPIYAEQSQKEPRRREGEARLTSEHTSELACIGSHELERSDSIEGFRFRATRER